MALFALFEGLGASQIPCGRIEKPVPILPSRTRSFNVGNLLDRG
jgi:hypothetical protein